MGEENGPIHGYPFSFEEEDKGVVKNCNFENMKSLKVNKRGIMQFRANELTTKNDMFFRKCKVGDWNNHPTLEMAMQLDQITKQKLSGSGLTLHVTYNA